MTTRQLSPAEHQQRARAALKSGAFSGVKVGALSAVYYQRALWRLENVQGTTTHRQRLLLHEIADYDAQITLASAWLDEQPHPLLKDEKTGEIWSLVEKRDGWARSRATLADKLPDVDVLPRLGRL